MHRVEETAKPHNVDPDQQASHRAEGWLAKLHHYLASRAGRHTPDELRRLYFLKRALISHDEFFVLTNELLALWVFDRRKCAELLGLPMELVGKACAEFDYILGPVHSCGRDVLAWMVDFPLGLRSIDVSEIPGDLIQSISALFSLLGRESPSPVHRHVARWGIPLRHSELLGEFHISSPTLCAGFWHYSRVLLGVHDIPENAKVIAAMDRKFGEDRDFHISQTHSAEEHARHDVELEASYRALLSVAVINQGRGESQTVVSPRDIPDVQTQAQVHQQQPPFTPNSHGQVQQQAHARQQQAQDHQLQAQQQGYIRPHAQQQTPNQPLQPAQPQSMQQVQQHQAWQNNLQQLLQQPRQQLLQYLQNLHQQNPQRAQDLERLLHQHGYFQQERTPHHPQQPVDPRSQQQPHAQQQLHTQMQHPYHSQPQHQPRPSSQAPSSPYVSPSSLLGPGQLGAGYVDGRNQQAHARIPLAAPPGEPGGAPTQPGLASHQISQVRVGNATATAISPTSDMGTPTMGSPAVRASSVKSRVRTTLPRQGLPRERYYQYIDSLLAGPVPLKPNSALVKFEFDISESDFRDRAQVGMARDGGSLVYGYFEGCRRMHFRICAMPIRKMGEDSTIAENKWVTAPTVWPEVLTAKVNEDGFLEFARKREFGKNLPCEITGYLRPGRNVLSVGVMLPPPEGYCFYGAVELVHTASRSSIMSIILAQRVLAEADTLNIIKSRLSKSPGGGDDDDDDDDDEIQIMDPEICINLADPYSGSLVDVPCRGETCAHLDVFDLRMLLETRAVKESCAHGTRARGSCPECVARPSERLELSQTDVWGCPICNEDVRPGRIVVDGFLKGVVEELRRVGGDARVVLVDAEGKWRAKVEAKKTMQPRESIVISD